MLIRNLILGPPTKRDDGETVLIQDYGLTTYVGWNPSRMEQRNGCIDRKLQREHGGAGFPWPDSLAGGKPTG